MGVLKERTREGLLLDFCFSDRENSVRLLLTLDMDMVLSRDETWPPDGALHILLMGEKDWSGLTNSECMR